MEADQAVYWCPGPQTSRDLSREQSPSPLSDILSSTSSTSLGLETMRGFPCRKLQGSPQPTRSLASHHSVRALDPASPFTNPSILYKAHKVSTITIVLKMDTRTIPKSVRLYKGHLNNAGVVAYRGPGQRPAAEGGHSASQAACVDGQGGPSTTAPCPALGVAACIQISCTSLR